MEYTSGERVKKTRLDLGLTQEDMVCRGLTQIYISRVETGELELTPQKAIIISNKFNLERKKRNIDLGYEITPTLFTDIKNIEIDRLINNLKDNTGYCYIEINEFLKDCTKEVGEKLIDRMYTDVFKYNIYRHKDRIKEYLTKQLRFIQSRKKVVETYIRLIAAWKEDESDDRYEHIVFLSKLIENDVNLCDENRRISYYANVSTAYYEIKEYDEALHLIEKGKKIKNNPYIYNLLNTEAIIYTKQKRYKKAINIHNKIINESEDIDYIANSLSNKADIYNAENKFELASEFINKAFEFIDNISIYYKFNLWYVKLQIEIEQKININESFKNTLIQLKELDDKVETRKILEMVTKYYKENNFEIVEIVEILKAVGISIDSNVFIKKIILPLADEKTRKIIEHIAYY